MSGFYKVGKQDLLARNIPAEAGIVAYGVNEDYVFDSAHTDFATFEPLILLPEKALTGLTFADGVLKADQPEWIAAGAGVEDRSLQLAGLILAFKLDDTGTLFAFIDSAQAGLPSSVNGSNVTAVWDSNGILKL